MKLNSFSNKQHHATLLFRLILAIGLIILFCQLICVLWLWHESKEQVNLMVEAILQNSNNQKTINKEVRGAVASLILPSVLMVSLCLTLCYQAVKRIIRPLSELQRQLENRSEDNLEPINYKESVAEIDAVVLAINRLMSRLTSTIERERLFTGDVAHELRTPLAGLRLHLELLEKKHNAAVRPLLKRLDYMTNSVSQLLQLARVGQSFSSGNYQAVSLKEDVVTPMAQEVIGMLSARNQQLSIIARDESTIRGDATLIRVLLRNLLENAHRYSPEQSTITITIEAADNIELIVEDEGPGIDESKRGELSKAFTRMDSRYGGIGLGLSIVTRIAQLHRAQFFLQNREGIQGCRASVTFPRQ